MCDKPRYQRSSLNKKYRVKKKVNNINKDDNNNNNELRVTRMA